MSKTINTANAVTTFTAFDLDAMNTELQARGLTDVEDINMAATILASGIRSLDEFAATMINLAQGNIDSADLRDAMEVAFPEHKISDRHGSHYLSLARNGNLQGNIECRFAPPKATRKPRGKKGVNIDLSAMDEKQLKLLAKVSPELEAAVTAWQAKQEAAK